MVWSILYFFTKGSKTVPIHTHKEEDGISCFLLFHSTFVFLLEGSQSVFYFHNLPFLDREEVGRNLLPREEDFYVLPVES